MSLRCAIEEISWDIRLEFLRAALHGDAETVRDLAETYPLVVNAQDGITGCTALHFGIFAQHREVVSFLAEHADFNIELRDRFNRSAADMLTYTSDRAIFEAVMRRLDPDF